MYPEEFFKFLASSLPPPPAMTPDLPIPTEEVEPADSVCRWSNCGLSFECLEDLVTHLTAAHVTSQQGSYFCMWQGCSRDKGFNARYKMLIHIRTHTNERPFVCSHLQCGKRFSRQENLRIHARTHTGEKPYVCSVPGCGKAYSNSSDRFKHSRTHQVDKPYECRHPGCGKRYTDPSSLRKHVKIYSHSSKKLEDSSLSNIPPPSISPSSSGSSSLGTSPVPMAPTPPSLLPASFFSPSHSSMSGCGGVGGYSSPSSAAAVWTMALQQYQINDSFRQYQTELLLRGRAAVSPVDLNFASSGFMPYSPMSNGIGEEHEDDSRDRGLLTMESPDRTMDGIPERSESPGGMDPDPRALDLSTSPLDLSMPSARRRYQ